jgi:hypothetical protein
VARGARARHRLIHGSPIHFCKVADPSTSWQPLLSVIGVGRSGTSIGAGAGPAEPGRQAAMRWLKPAVVVNHEALIALHTTQRSPTRGKHCEE